MNYIRLLYADDQIRYKLSYKEGKRRKQHYVYLRGAVSAIQDRIASSDISEQSGVYSRYMEDIPCHVCHGAKLRQDVLKYKVEDMNYSEVEQMEFTSLRSWLQGINYNYASSEKEELVSQLIDGMIRKIDALIKLNVGYLCLNRSIPSLSDGENNGLELQHSLHVL